MRQQGRSSLARYECILKGFFTMAVCMRENYSLTTKEFSWSKTELLQQTCLLMKLHWWVCKDFPFNALLVLITIVDCISVFIKPVFQHQTNIVKCQIAKCPSCWKFHFPSPSVFLYQKITSEYPCVCVSPGSAVCKSHVITSINHSTLANTLVGDPEILLTGIILQEITYCWLTAAAKYFIRRSDNPKLPKEFLSVASGAASVCTPLGGKKSS